MGFLSKLFGGGTSNNRPSTSSQKNESVVKTKYGDVKISIETHTPDRYEPEIPPLQGDYAKAVFLWATAKPSILKTKENSAGYFLYELGIKDVAKYQKQLINEGYYELASPAQKLNYLKLPELKEMLKVLDRPVSGKKEVLIDRILGAADETFINRYFPDEIYCLSDKGRDFLNNHIAYAEIHKHRAAWNISWQEYDRAAAGSQDYLAVVWGILKEKLAKATLQESRMICYEMYTVLDEQGKRSDALEMLLRVFYLDLNACGMENMIQGYYKKFWTKKQLKEDFNIAVMLAPGIIERIEKLKDLYDEEIIFNIFAWKKAYPVCDQALFTKIVNSIVDGSYDEEKVKAKLKAAYNKMIDSL